MPEFRREQDWEEDAAFKQGLRLLSPLPNASHNDALDEALLAQLKSPILAPTPASRIPLRSVLQQFFGSAVCAGLIGAALLLVVLKVPYSPSRTELKSHISIMPPPPVPLDSLLRNKTPRAANLWSHPTNTTVPMLSTPRKSENDGNPQSP